VFGHKSSKKYIEDLNHDYVIASYLTDGATITSVAKAFGTSNHTITKILKRNGIQRKSKASTKETRLKAKEIAGKREEATRRYLDKWGI
jgi:transposase